MENIKCKIHFCSVCLIFLLSFFLISCQPGNPNEITSHKYHINIDDSVYLSSFPSEVYLELGKSILIENSGTAFRFIDILEYDEYNSSVLLQVEYGTGKLKTIILNTTETPQSYDLENGYNHVIELIDVYETGGTFRIVFTYDEYFTG
jgi:hypothetical protein